jgi:hypothetical protein
MSDTPLLIHIGYHKTATTWMQTKLFQPVQGYRMLADHDEIFAHAVRPHGLMFTPDAMRALIAERCAGLPEGHVAVVSSEILSGHPFFGGQMSDTYAHRLKAIAPDAKILISIRAQLKILASVYMQYVLRGGTLPCDRFFAGTDWPGFFGFEQAHFEYDRLVALYQSLFGAENVYVMTQESLQADMEAASTALAAFADNSAYSGLTEAAREVRGASYPEYTVGVHRRLNHFYRSPVTPGPFLSLDPTGYRMRRRAISLLRRAPFSTLFKGKRPVTDYVRKTYAGQFAASNARLAALISHPIDLSAYEGGTGSNG